MNRLTRPGVIENLKKLRTMVPATRPLPATLEEGWRGPSADGFPRCGGDPGGGLMSADPTPGAPLREYGRVHLRNLRAG
jgi:hypothetical protein